MTKTKTKVKAVEPYETQAVPLPAFGSGVSVHAQSWARPDSNPAQEICNAMADIRIRTERWPTVLTLSQAAFEDLCHHPESIKYLSHAQLSHSYDCMRGPHARVFLGHMLGLSKIELIEDGPAAALG